MPTVNKVCTNQKILPKRATEQVWIIKTHQTRGEKMHGANHGSEMIMISEVLHGTHWSFQKKLG